MESSFLRELAELAKAGKNHGKGYVGMVLLEFRRKVKKGFRFSRVDTGKPLQEQVDSRVGPDWELCTNWAESQERESETQSVGDCHTWVKSAEACEIEVRRGARGAQVC